MSGCPSNGPDPAAGVAPPPPLTPSPRPQVKKRQRAALRDAVRVEVSSKYQTVDKLQQYYLFIPAKYKVRQTTSVLPVRTGCFINNVTSSKRNISGNNACISTNIAQYNLKVIRNKILNDHKKALPQAVTVATNLLSKFRWQHA